MTRRAEFDDRRRSGYRPGSGRYGRAVDHCRRYGAAMKPTRRQRAAASSSGTMTGDVWTFAAPDRQPVQAALPLSVPLRCIAAGCPAGGTVLDPFTGTATTGLAARQLGRAFIGIEPDTHLCEQAKAQLQDGRGETGWKSL